MTAVRPPAVAGSFYPALPQVLRAEVSRRLTPALAPADTAAAQAPVQTSALRQP